MRSSCGTGALKSAGDRAGRGGRRGGGVDVWGGWGLQGWSLKGLEDAGEAVMIYMKENRR